MNSSTAPLEILISYKKWNKYSWASIIGPIEMMREFQDNKISIEVVHESILEKIPVFPYNKEYFLMFSTNSIDSRSVIKEIQEIRQYLKLEENNELKVKIIVGGPHASAKPEDFLKIGADLVFTGESELSLPLFLKQFIHNRDLNSSEFCDIKKIPNLAYLKQTNNEIVHTNSFLSPNIDNFAAFAPYTRLFRPIEITRGCPFGCKFCQTSKIFGYKMRHRSCENIILWAKMAIKLKIDKIWFTSPNVFAWGSKTTTPNTSKIENLLKNLKPIPKLKKIFFGTFPGEVRPDSVNQNIIETIQPFISNDSFAIGAQSASPSILKTTGRGHTVEQIWDAIEIINANDFKANIDMMFGLPSENGEDVQLNIDFIHQVLKNKRNKIHGHVFMPLPGTEYECKPPGIIHDELAKVIGKYAQKGRIYGSHFHQQKIAKQLNSNLNS